MPLPQALPQAGTAAQQAAAAPAAASPAADNRVYRIDELPDDVRRRVPALTIGGSRYSPDPGKRFLVVNGRVLREQDPVTPEVRLDEIGLRSAVLRIGNYRYGISF
jgi:general secretion pathway protein B